MGPRPSEGCGFTREHYREILEIGLSAGYRFVGFDTIAETRESDTPTCILRHDCDNDLVAAERMSCLEHELGVVGTYCLMVASSMYNLLSPPNLALVARIASRGMRFGLHFDEHAYPHAGPGDVSDLVDRDARLLEERLGVSLDVVTFHQPSEAVLDGRVRTSLLSSYDRDRMAGFHYLSESNTVWREGCACGFLSELKHPRLQLLIHPEWWTDEEMPIREKWNLMFRHNFELSQESMLQRERAYEWRQSITFEPEER